MVTEEVVLSGVPSGAPVSVPVGGGGDGGSGSTSSPALARRLPRPPSVPSGPAERDLHDPHGFGFTRFHVGLPEPVTVRRDLVRDTDKRDGCRES